MYGIIKFATYSVTYKNNSELHNEQVYCNFTEFGFEIYKETI